MQAFGLVGDGVDDVLGELLARLEGRTAVVHTGAAASEPTTDGGLAAARADTEYRLGDDWRATGRELSLDGALDRLAPDHDYAVVRGDPSLEVPGIVVGEGDYAGETVYASADSGSFDVASAVAAVDDCEPHETLESLVAAVKRSAAADRAGAIATFTGRVRARDGPDDDRTRYLEFEKYDGVADRTMREIEAELADREGVFEVRLHHRVGRVDAGEDIVFVVVLAGHRREAFRTVEDGIDRLKAEVPLFKKEVTERETFWVHERDRSAE